MATKKTTVSESKATKTKTTSSKAKTKDISNKKSEIKKPGRAKAGEKKPVESKTTSTKIPKVKTVEKKPSEAKTKTTATKSTKKKATAKTTKSKAVAKEKETAVKDLVKEVQKNSKATEVDNLVENIVVNEENTDIKTEEVKSETTENKEILVEDVKILEEKAEEKEKPQEEKVEEATIKETEVVNVNPTLDNTLVLENEKTKEEVSIEQENSTNENNQELVIKDSVYKNLEATDNTNVVLNVEENNLSDDNQIIEEVSKKKGKREKIKGPNKYRAIANSINLIGIFAKLGFMSFLAIFFFSAIIYYGVYSELDYNPEETNAYFLLSIITAGLIGYLTIAFIVSLLYKSYMDKRGRNKILLIINFIFGGLFTFISTIFYFVYLYKTRLEPYIKETKQQTVLRRYSVDNDITYRGPLSYRMLRFIGWVSICVMIVISMSSLSSKITGKPFFNESGALSTILGYSTGLTVPLFLIATFATILNRNKSYKSVIVFYLGAFLGVSIGVLIAYERYLGAFMKAVAQGMEMDITPADLVGTTLQRNVFADFLTLSLFYFFVTYTPTKYFQGNKIKIFRLLVIIPLGFAVASYMLKVFSKLGYMKLPVEIYPFLTTKPPLIYIVFVVIVIWIKFRAKSYYKYGGTRAGYLAYLKTNKNSFAFSLVVGSTLVFVSLFDIGLYSIMLFLEKGDIYINAYEIGNCASLFVAVPIILLFSYTRKYINNDSLDLLITLAGVGMIALTVVECTYQIICRIG